MQKCNTRTTPDITAPIMQLECEVEKYKKKRPTGLEKAKQALTWAPKQILLTK